MFSFPVCIRIRPSLAIAAPSEVDISESQSRATNKPKNKNNVELDMPQTNRKYINEKENVKTNRKDAQRCS